MKTLLSKIITISFFLNLIWENLQMPLYLNYAYGNFSHHFAMCVLATVIDTLLVLVFYSIFAIVHRNIWWVTNISKLDILFLLLIGGFIAISIEKISVGHYWNYTNLMPLIPIFKVGLIPVLQMLLLPLITFLLVKKTIRIG